MNFTTLPLKTPLHPYRIKLSAFELMALPYQSGTFPASARIIEEIHTTSEKGVVDHATPIAKGGLTALSIDSHLPFSQPTADTAASTKAVSSMHAIMPTLTIAIKMPQEYGPRSWRW